MADTDADLPRRLQALLDNADGAKPLTARLETMARAAEGGPLADLMADIAREAAAAQFAAQVALARAQHRLIHGVTPPPEHGTRLTGEARAVGLMLAKALDRLPRDQARQVFSEADHLADHPDLSAAGVVALDHYIGGGAAEGRLPGGLRRIDPALYAQGGGLPASDIDSFLAETEPRYPEALHPALRSDALRRAADTGPAISVLIPSWNRAQVVASAVHAALNQSYAAHEVIVIDDGSTDGTAELLAARFADPLAEGRLRLLERPHEGVSAARNAGLAAAQGEIITYLDSDNTWEPDHLLYIAAAFAARPRLQSVYTGVVRHNLDDGWSDVLFQPFDRTALETDNTIDLNGFAHRRALTERLGGFDTALDRLVDWDLVLRLTEATPPQAIPVLSAHHVISARYLSNITVTRDAERNAAHIRESLAGRRSQERGRRG